MKKFYRALRAFGTAEGAHVTAPMLNARAFCPLNMNWKVGCNHPRDFVLYIEKVNDDSVTAFGPQTITGGRFQKLSSDPSAIAKSPYAAFHDVARQAFGRILSHQLTLP